MATTAPLVVPTPAAWLRAFAFCLGRVRFSAVFLVVGLALLLSDQGRDLIVTSGEDGEELSLSVAALAWALSTWWWARLLLDIRYGDAPTHAPAYGFWRKWLPRAFGVLALGTIALAGWRAGQGWLAFGSLAALAIFLPFVIWRRALGQRLARWLETSDRDARRTMAGWVSVADFDLLGAPPHAGLREALRPGGTLGPRSWGAVAMVLSSIVLYTLGHWAPVWLGTRTGAMLLVFVWAITTLPVVSFLSYLAERRGVPLLTTAVVIAVLSSFWNDNHEIRRAQGGAAPPDRLTIQQALVRWSARNRSEGGAPTPLVVVATAGGGIRAAYWTATVLGELHDRAPAFPDRAFAVSGVSGGSVGAAVYRALQPLDPNGLRGPCHKGRRACGQAVLAEEFLGPLAAAMLYPDLAQRLVPFPWFPDRARALEESWETGFKKVTGRDALAGSLASLSGEPGTHLFLNATWADNGRRIVASDLRFGGTDAAMVLSNDELAVLGRDLRLSTAAHNSARFPFVSPPGMWRNQKGIAGRLQDGGLFENYGAETAIELVDEVCRAFACKVAAAGDRGGMRPVRPVVVLITSDPGLPPSFIESPRKPPLRFGYELRTTFATYEAVRNGRGAEAAASLVERVHRVGGRVFEFRMCDADGVRPPLGWSLSIAARDQIDKYLFPGGTGATAPSCLPSNAAALRELVALLGGPAGF